MFDITYRTNGNIRRATTYKDAVLSLKTGWPSAVIGHAGDLTDGGDRTLCWRDEASAAHDDDGENAIAVITRSSNG